MILDDAIRYTEILLAFAFLQQSLEHFKALRNEQILFIPRLLLSLCLMIGVYTPWVCLALFALAIAMLHRFQGPYNGGSDRMSILVLACLCLVHFMPTPETQEYVYGYLAAQLTLSYFISGWVKIVNPEWRSGQALVDVFRFSAYPVSESLRGWTEHPGTLLAASWGVILFELIFPLTLISQYTLIAGLSVAAAFHFSNACFFGLNRFFWIWLSAYPSIIWFQERVFG